MKICLDIEANGLVNPDKIWCVVCKDIDKGEYHVFRNLTDDLSERERFVRFCDQATLYIGHNLLSYDRIVIQQLLGIELNLERVLDTLIVSKLVDYPRQGHSVEDYGIEFGFPKGIPLEDGTLIESRHLPVSFYGKWSQDLENYCRRDVDITHKIYLKYLKYISNPEHKASLDLEHSFQIVVNNLQDNGFSFNVVKAKELLYKVEGELKVLDKGIHEAFLPRLKLIRTVIPKETKYGTISLSSIPKVLRQDIAEFTVGAPFSYCHWVNFNPSSHKQIVSLLNEAGWRPVDKTETHKDTDREYNKLKYHRHNVELDIRLKELYNKLQILKETGWKVSENNLDTLPDTDHLILWKDKCRIKIARDEKSSNKTTTLRTLTLNEQQLAQVTGKTLASLENDSSKEIMALALPILKDCTNNSPDCVKFVENQRHLWSIIVTPTTVFVDCSASFVMDTWDGMRDIPSLQRRISQNQSARLLSKRILLEARRRTLTEWIDLVQEDGRIHGKFYGIGAWTHRMAHQKPNTANIPLEYDSSKSPPVKKLYGKELRALWQAPKNRLLLGCDAEGIQLRIFAHYINDPEFTEALVNGKKELKTDPHSLNQSILGDVCTSRQAAKRYIYALLLGAGQGKLREILDCDERAAGEAYERLLARYTGFAHLKETIIPRDAKRGWFSGLDGRRVRIPGDTEGGRRHLAMSGYLQNGEAVIMKKATMKWVGLLPDLDCKLVNFVHDEWQTEVPNNMEIALRVASLQADSLRIVGEELGLRCPLAGSYWNDDLGDYTIDKNWSKTH